MWMKINIKDTVPNPNVNIRGPTLTNQNCLDFGRAFNLFF